ncbi:zinc finger CCCH domain-containing protein 59 isoform X1 [Dendrobium catenatum]|uniref:Zinc finger CCCH domain-containing protein 59 n=1 Tax=Dendrobium catenatum TaxID=906689 RepID=A0A2I0VXZ8_9ASPA|nr:zinc finger CCCH domain-containing protein 59 isoform X1 [Dendrobium catenatum]PKU68284.1 Zinc finger CCCH domain-containing protein 59 [Dendrobium catenatum]
MVSSSPRILLCGDVLGRLNQLFKRVQSVNKSTGPFDALLCVGQFFPDTADNLEEVANYLDGLSPIPISTYFIGDYGAGATRFLSAAAKIPSNKGFKMDGLEVCPNLYWLKGSGKFSFHGLSIFYLSGRQIPDAEGNGRYSRDDVDALRALAEEPGVVDIFMTNEWPSGVWNRTDLSEAALGVSDPSGSDPVVAELAVEIKPRYHIAGTKDVFYAREPYSNDDAVHVTRFLGLATVGNKEKQKFIHAISPTPASAIPASEIHLKPPNTTVSPYDIEGTSNHLREQAKRPANSDSANQYWRFDVSKKRPRHDGLSGERLCFKYTSSGACAQGKKCSYRHDEDAREQYLKNVCFDFLNKGRCERGPDCRFRHSLVEEGDILSQGGQGSQNGKSYRTIPEKKCWFCLSSPDAEVHLVLSIGESYYCALAKGPLVEDHALLIPIEHHPNTLTTTSESEVELGKYKDALKVYFKNQEKAVVFFEWIFRSSPHANIQVVPIPLAKASNIQRIFNFAAKKLGFEFSVVASSGDHSEARISLRSKFDGKSNLFYVELPDGNILSYSVADKEKLPVQFGREVLAGLLNMADRADWRNCKLSKEDELQMVEKFKKGFEELDPAA